MQAQILIYITTFIFYTSALLIHDGLIAGVTNKQGSDSATNIKRFKIRNAQAVEDHQTGLIWQRCSWGLKGNDCAMWDASRVPWQEALLITSMRSTEDCETWRLPSLVELNSLVEPQSGDVQIDQHYFSNTQATWYWTATTFDLTNSWIKVVSFADGSQFDSLANSSGVLRLVCGEHHRVG